MEPYCAIETRGTDDFFGDRFPQHSCNEAQSPLCCNEEPMLQNRAEYHGVAAGGVCAGPNLQDLDGDRGADGMSIDRVTLPDWLLPHIPVSALFHGTWYPAHVREVLPTGTIFVLWDGEYSQLELSLADVRPRDQSFTPTLNDADYGAQSAHSESERPARLIDQNMFPQQRISLERDELATSISQQVIRPCQPPEQADGQVISRTVFVDQVFFTQENCGRFPKQLVQLRVLYNSSKQVSAVPSPNLVAPDCRPPTCRPPDL